MAYPLDNLGDYNIVRNDLKEADGNVETLYKNIEAVFIAKARPQIYKEGCWTGFGIGAGAGVGICAAIYGGYKYYKYKKDKKKALQTEPELKDELAKTVEVSCKTEVEEKYSSASNK